MTSLNVVRWGRLAAMLSGMLFVAKGVAILVSDADPSFVPPATLLFALGMVGLHARLGGRGGPLGTIGVLLAWVVVGPSVVNLTGLALPIPTPGEPDASLLLRITYIEAFLGILVGLLALGVAALRARVLPTPWHTVPLAVGVLWFPLQGIGFVIADGVGLILGGLAWVLLGYVLWSGIDRTGRASLAACEVNFREPPQDEVCTITLLGRTVNKAAVAVVGSVVVRSRWHGRRTVGHGACDHRYHRRRGGQDRFPSGRARSSPEADRSRRESRPRPSRGGGGRSLLRRSRSDAAGPGGCPDLLHGVGRRDPRSGPAAHRLRRRDAAVAAGVERIVYLSFLGAGPQATFTFARHHWWTEEHVRTTGLRHTFLRNSLYLDLLPMFTGTDGVIRGPAGGGRVAAVARDDIADVAVSVLLGEGHDGRTYDVTGPEAITLHEAAEELSRFTGRPVTYHAETLEEAYAARASYGAPEWEVEGWVTSYVAIATGEMNVVSDTVSRLTGHAPMGLVEFLRRYPESYRHLERA